MIGEPQKHLGAHCVGTSADSSSVSDHESLDFTWEKVDLRSVVLFWPSKVWVRRRQPECRRKCPPMEEEGVTVRAHGDLSQPPDLSGKTLRFTI